MDQLRQRSAYSFHILEIQNSVCLVGEWITPQNFRLPSTSAVWVKSPSSKTQKYSVRTPILLEMQITPTLHFPPIWINHTSSLAASLEDDIRPSKLQVLVCSPRWKLSDSPIHLLICIPQLCLRIRVIRRKPRDVAPPFAVGRMKRGRRLDIGVRSSHRLAYDRREWSGGARIVLGRRLGPCRVGEDLLECLGTPGCRSPAGGFERPVVRRDIEHIENCVCLRSLLRSHGDIRGIMMGL